MNSILTSRQRMLAALSCQPPDHTPCSFMLFKGLHTRSRSYLEFLQAQLDMGFGHHRPASSQTSARFAMTTTTCMDCPCIMIRRCR